MAEISAGAVAPIFPVRDIGAAVDANLVRFGSWLTDPPAKVVPICLDVAGGGGGHFPGCPRPPRP